MISTWKLLVVILYIHVHKTTRQTYIHINIHSYIHTLNHPTMILYIYTLMHRYSNMNAKKNASSEGYSHIYIYIYIQTQVHTYTYISSYTNADAQEGYLHYSWYPDLLLGKIGIPRYPYVHSKQLRSSQCPHPGHNSRRWWWWMQQAWWYQIR